MGIRAHSGGMWAFGRTERRLCNSGKHFKPIDKYTLTLPLQISPPSEHMYAPGAISDTTWYQRWRVVSFSLENTDAGSAFQFNLMIQTCNANNIQYVKSRMKLKSFFHRVFWLNYQSFCWRRIESHDQRRRGQHSWISRKFIQFCNKRIPRVRGQFRAPGFSFLWR